MTTHLRTYYERYIRARADFAAELQRRFPPGFTVTFKKGRMSNYARGIVIWSGFDAGGHFITVRRADNGAEHTLELFHLHPRDQEGKQ